MFIDVMKVAERRMWCCTVPHTERYELFSSYSFKMLNTVPE